MLLWLQKETEKQNNSEKITNRKANYILALKRPTRRIYI